MLKMARFGVAAAALMLATPAMASDFSGIGRIFLWGLLAIAALIAVPAVLVARKGRGGNTETNVMLAGFVGVTLAPAIAFQEPDQWVFTPFPGAGLAMLEGSWAVLFPVPLISMLVCSLCFYALLRLGDPASSPPDGEP